MKASYLSKGGFLELRAAVMRAVWSRFRLRLFRRYLSLRSEEVPRVYRLLDLVHDGCPGHGPLHALVASARRICFHWDFAMTRWASWLE